ncbi:MAG: geranylgeranyl diphosphate reductase [Gemmatimonadales bacterium]|nr:geranylgeranyl diphosphate reductase [Gemmatimonadales bacterium]
METFDCVVVGGGPAGATAAADLAAAGRSVLLLDRAGRIKPCGGAVPPQLLADFDVPESVLCNKVDGARIIAPSHRKADMPIGNGFVGMVDRGPFDEWLRERARGLGAERRTGLFNALEQQPDGTALVRYKAGRSRGDALATVRARMVIGADGALSAVARQAMPKVVDEAQFVFAYHEVVESPAEQTAEFLQSRCDVYYEGTLSPDFYAWVFPHGPTTSVGTGSLQQGFALRRAVAELRARTGLDRVATIREEGAPIPLKPLSRWDNGRNVVLAGDAAGVVAPASGEGIFYAMTGGREAARAVHEALAEADGRVLGRARKRFMRRHGLVFRVLDRMQETWYRDDDRRERFVDICRDVDVQKLTWQGYMYKKLVFARPAAHVRIFLKNIGHLTGIIAPSPQAA